MKFSTSLDPNSVNMIRHNLSDISLTMITLLLMSGIAVFFSIADGQSPANEITTIDTIL